MRDLPGEPVSGATPAALEHFEVALAHWSGALPGHHAVLAMHAFGLEECGEYGPAEDFARRALERNPLDARAHHTLAHVFEMTGRADRGLRWMADHQPRWARGLRTVG